MKWNKEYGYAYILYIVYASVKYILTILILIFIGQLTICVFTSNLNNTNVQVLWFRHNSSITQLPTTTACCWLLVTGYCIQLDSIHINTGWDFMHEITLVSSIEKSSSGKFTNMKNSLYILSLFSLTRIYIHYATV